MTSTTEETSTIHYSGNKKTMVSVPLKQQDGRKYNTISTSNNTTQENSTTERGEQ